MNAVDFDLMVPKIDERKLKELATAKGKLLKKYLEAGDDTEGWCDAHNHQ